MDLSDPQGQVHEHAVDIISRTNSYPTLPKPLDIKDAEAAIKSKLPDVGIGSEEAIKHLIYDIAKGLNASSLSPHYYGFVTGGATPAAREADHLATLYDQNIQVHLPGQTVATTVESRALEMLLQLLNLDQNDWKARTLTTGATASNILGLACGRQWVLEERLRRLGHGDDQRVAEIGMLSACQAAEINEWQVLTTMAHSSLRKAASVVGLGSACVVDVKVRCAHGSINFDMDELEKRLSRPGVASIVVISCGEVNTGWFATRSKEDMAQIRELCNHYAAWLHIDGAFGIFARLLEDTDPSFARLVGGVAGMELADSIAGDGHKMLNVPYDCGFFFSKLLSLQQRVFQNPNATYLSSAASIIPSPLNIGIENSRRFRGLPLYATLIANGRQGYASMVQEQVRLARAVANWLVDHREFRLLQHKDGTDWQADIFMIVLFQARDNTKNDVLVERINQGRKIYVSGTNWEGRKAARIAVANWQAHLETDFRVITEALESAIAVSDLN